MLIEKNCAHFYIDGRSKLGIAIGSKLFGIAMRGRYFVVVITFQAEAQPQLLFQKENVVWVLLS